MSLLLALVHGYQQRFGFYVKIRDKSQIASLQNVRTSPVVHYHRGEMLARVGVYRDTKVGHRCNKAATATLEMGSKSISCQ